MLDAISATQVAMLQDQLRLQSINQNVSNMQVPGYKRQHLETTGFDEHLSVNMATVSRQMQPMIQNQQGSLVQSHRPNELAIAGPGFFTVQTQNGQLYTRRGDFHLNERGELSTANGATLVGTNGSITINDNAYTIDTHGTVFIDNQPVDSLNLVAFDHPEQLQYRGEGMYESNTTPQAMDPHTKILQGHLEQSNIKTMDEMMNMVQTARHFEATQRIMQVANGLLSMAIHQLGDNNV
jgi:flagellar basal-body rod protein FlgF